MKRAEQYQKQLYRAEEDRRQALATSEALTALWQKKFEKAQNENYDLRSEHAIMPHTCSITYIYMYMYMYMYKLHQKELRGAHDTCG